MSTAEHTEENVYTALLAFHGESPALQKTKLNPAFKSKYIALEHLISEVVPLLTKHGLVWLTFPESAEGEPCLRYELTHAKSGTRVEGRMPLHSKGNLPQDQGSAITYARRYSMMAVLGLAADEDDDGSRASKARAARPAPAPNGGAPTVPTLSPEKRELVLGAIKDAKQNPALVLGAVGLERLEDMTAHHAREIKVILDGVAA